MKKCRPILCMVLIVSLLFALPMQSFALNDDEVSAVGPVDGRGDRKGPL